MKKNLSIKMNIFQTLRFADPKVYIFHVKLIIFPSFRSSFFPLLTKKLFPNTQMTIGRHIKRSQYIFTSNRQKGWSFWWKRKSRHQAKSNRNEENNYMLTRSLCLWATTNLYRISLSTPNEILIHANEYEKPKSERKKNRKSQQMKSTEIFLVTIGINKVKTTPIHSLGLMITQ